MDEQIEKSGQKRSRAAWLMWLLFFILTAAIATPLVALFVFKTAILFTSALFIAPVIIGGLALAGLIGASVWRLIKQNSVEQTKTKDKATINIIQPKQEKKQEKIEKVVEKQELSDKEKIKIIKSEGRNRKLSLESAKYLMGLYNKEKSFFVKETSKTIEINKEILEANCSDEEQFEKLAKYYKSIECSKEWEAVNKKTGIMDYDVLLNNVANNKYNLQDVQEFIQKEPDLNFKDEYGHTILDLACLNENTGANLIELFIEKDQSLVNRLSSSKQTPLMLACYSNNQKVVEVLLKHEADVNIQDKNKQDAMFMLFYGEFIVVKKPHTERRKSKLVSIENIKGIVPLLLEKMTLNNIYSNVYSNGTILDIACTQGDEDIVRFLLENGAELHNLKNTIKLGPEISKVILLEKDILEKLLERGLNPTFNRNNFKLTSKMFFEDVPEFSLEIALNEKREDIFWLLVNYGADVDRWETVDAYNAKLKKTKPELAFFIGLLKQHKTVNKIKLALNIQDHIVEKGEDVMKSSGFKEAFEKSLKSSNAIKINNNNF